LEADLRRYYGIRLSDLWKPDPPFNLRELINYVYGLPPDAASVKWLNNTPLDYKDEIQFIMLDMLAQNIYQTKIAAAALAGKDYRKVADKGPKPIERPKLRQPEKPPPKFVSAKELRAILNKRKVTIHHTPECIASRVNEGGQKLNCACPRG